MSCCEGFPPAEFLFCRASLVGALSTSWTDLNGPSGCKLRHCEDETAQMGSKWEPDANIPALSALPCLALRIHWSLDQKLAQWKRPSDPSHKLSAPLCGWLVVLCHFCGCGLDRPATEFAGLCHECWKLKCQY